MAYSADLGWFRRLKGIRLEYSKSDSLFQTRSTTTVERNGAGLYRNVTEIWHETDLYQRLESAFDGTYTVTIDTRTKGQIRSDTVLVNKADRVTDEDWLLADDLLLACATCIKEKFVDHIQAINQVGGNVTFKLDEEFGGLVSYSLHIDPKGGSEFKVVEFSWFGNLPFPKACTLKFTGQEMEPVEISWSISRFEEANFPDDYFVYHLPSGVNTAYFSNEQREIPILDGKVLLTK